MIEFMLLILYYRKYYYIIVINILVPYFENVFLIGRSHV